MADGSLSGAVRRLCDGVERRGVGSDTDAELLARFVTRRDQSAFEHLVRRHDRMVRGVCRRVLRGDPDVDDVWQATFLTLARKAGEVGKAGSLGGWLYRVAYRMAVRVRADAARRRRHEFAAGGPAAAREAEDPFHLTAQWDAREVVGEEIDRLPEKYRTPVVLCYLEGKTAEEAAELLGCPAGTVVTRLARTRERLRANLTRRGVTVGGTALVALLTLLPASEAAAPAARAVVAQAAVAFADHDLAGTLVSPQVLSLTTGACHAMSLNRYKLVAAVLAALCLSGIGSGVWAARSPDEKPKAAVEQKGTPAEKPRAADEQKGKPDEKPKAKGEAPDAKSRHKAEEVVDRSFKTGKTPTVVLEVMNGRVAVVADAADAVTARLTKRNEAESEDEAKAGLKALELDMTHDTDQKRDVVRIKAKEPAQNRRHQFGVDAEVRVPPGAVLELRTSNGAVHLTGGTGDVTVGTSNGEVVVKDNKGRLQLTTSNGGITVTGAAGKIDLTTTNGPVALTAEKAVVKATTTNGAVAFAGSLADGSHTLCTTNGAIRLTLPSDAKFALNASTSNASITSEFDGNPSLTAGKGQMIATVGKDPKAQIAVQTSNGAIAIEKKK